MTYDVNSSWLDAPQATQQQWIELIQPHGCTDDVADIVARYFSHGNEIGLNADLALGQACIESAYFTSARWTEQRNPCGWGITGDNVPGVVFDSIDSGILVHYEHLVCYTMAEDPPIMANGTWPMLDTRHFFFDNIPQLFTLERPERRWAASGFSYVTNIASVVNHALGEPVPDMPPAVAPPVVFPVAAPVITKDDTFVNVWNAGEWGGRDQYPVRALVLHVMVGSYDGSIGWFHNTAAQASANYCISYDGAITETVDPDSQAPWANGISNPANTALPAGLSDLRNGWPNANFVTVSMETEGHDPDENGYPHAPEYQAVVQLMAYLCKKYKLHPSTDTICRHTYFDTVNRPHCPGDHWDFEGKLIPDVLAAMNIPSVVDLNDPMGVESADGQYRTFNFIPGKPVIGHDIYNYWKKSGVGAGITRYGYPLLSEETETKPDGTKFNCSWCERSRIEWFGPGDVRLGQLGTELLEYYNRVGKISLSPWEGADRSNGKIDPTIQKYYDANGGLEIFGYPVSPIVSLDGLQVQFFERQILELHPESQDWPVQGKRVGAEFIDARNSGNGPSVS